MRQVIASLRACEIPHAVMPLQNGVSVVLTQHGGRILGPFLTAESQSVSWMNPVLADAATLRAFVDAGEWNMGGDRVWIAPEIQYGVRDRTDFWNTLTLPPQMDPGNWSLSEMGSGWRLAQKLTLDAYNVGHGQKTLDVQRHIQLAADPLRSLRAHDELLTGVTYAGYAQTVVLSESRQDAIMSESWNLMQLNPGGELLIPATAGAEHSDYFEPIDAAHYALDAHGVRLRITGDRRYKVGYKAAHLFGRLGYANRGVDGRSYLLIRNFFNNPSMPYIEEPAAVVGCQGHSVHVYNDGGMFGGFGELECNGQTIGGGTGRTASTDTFVLWFYAGPGDQIRRIAGHLLGMEPRDM
jgi:hypothetical protein